MISQNSETHRMQQAFRRVMDAFARPGSLHVLPVAGVACTPCNLSVPLDTLVRMFVDQATTFFLCGTDEARRAIAAETRSKAAEAQAAAFIIAPREAGEEALRRTIEQACAGTLVSPEKGATVLCACERISDEPAEGLHAFAATGPGVKDVNRFYVDADAWAQARALRADEYPCGIEIVLVDDAGRIVAIPRSCTITVEEGGR